MASRHLAQLVVVAGAAYARIVTSDWAAEVLLKDDSSVFALELLQHVATRTSAQRKPFAPLVPHSLKVDGGDQPGRNSALDMQRLNYRQSPEYEDGTWSYTVDRPVKMVGWTTPGMAMADDPLKNYYTSCTFDPLPEINEDGVITDPDVDISDADVVLFYLPFFHRPGAVLPSTKRAGQLWIATCAEALVRPDSQMDCSYALDKEFMANFDGFAGYHGAIDFDLDPSIELFTTYSDPPDLVQMQTKPPKSARALNANGTGIMTFSSSDCSGDRSAWIQGLLQEFSQRGREDVLLSYGQCFNNAVEPPKDCEDNIYSWFDGWSNRCASRPLKLVSENVLEGWYITEKIWDAFWEGSVPVYFGPPEIKNLVPPDSIIYHGDFSSPAALADYLLAFDDAALAKARAWKSLPPSQWGGYLDARNFGHLNVLPRLCEAGAKAKREAEENMGTLSGI